jgi:Tol biopolymer transport system component
MRPAWFAGTCALALLALFVTAIRPTAAQPPGPGPAADLVLFSSDRDGQYTLFVMGLDGSNVRKVVDTPGKAFENALACNGRIATIVETPGTTWHSLWTVNLDGSDLRELTPGRIGEHMPTWRPDGFQIAFSSHRTGTRDIYLINADGSGEQQVTRVAAEETWPHWSPSAGLWLIQYGNGIGRSDIYTVTSDGQTYRQLTRTGDAMEPRWGPGGASIVFTRRNGRGADIWLADVSTPDPATGVRMWPVVDTAAVEHQPSYTPDGSRILFVRGREEDPEAEIWSVKLDGSDARNLTNAPGSHELWPATACLSPEVPTATPVTPSPTPPPSPTPLPPTATPPPGQAGCVCDIVWQRVPRAVIDDALAHPERYHGWRYLLDPGKPPGPMNPPRECLTLMNVNIDYHPIWNSPEWRVGCP